MKSRPLTTYFILLALISGAFLATMAALGQRANILAGIYMFGPAIAAALTRAFFYRHKFRDANIRLGKIRQYAAFWLVSLGITAVSFGLYTLMRAIAWDFSGTTFLGQLSQQFEAMGQSMEDLPAGFTPQTMLLMYTIGGLTVFNILPGILSGFGEEFGWRGFMFPRLYRIHPLAAFVGGGLIWFLWHVPLTLIMPSTGNMTAGQNTLNIALLAIGSVCTHTFLAYMYAKSRNVLVVSVAHITLNNAARSLSYYCAVTNQLVANAGLAVTMLAAVALLYFSGEWMVFERFAKEQETIIQQDYRMS